MATARRTGTNEDCRNDADTAWLGQPGTFGGSGQGRDFTSIVNWEVDNDVNCVTENKSPVLECYDDQATFPDTDVLDGSTCDATRFRILRPAAGQGHDGTPSNGVTFSVSSATGPVFQIAETFSQVQDLIATWTANTSTNFAVFTGTAADIKFIGCIADRPNNSGTGEEGCFRHAAASTTMYYILCLGINTNSGATQGAFRTNNAGGKPFLYNCTMIGADSAYWLNSVDGELKNCLGTGSTADNVYRFSSSVTNTSHCASDQAQGTGSHALAGTNHRFSQTFTFVNAGAQNYHLTTGDAGARNFGTDLSATGSFQFDDDIDLQLFNVWDIGFDEPQPAGGAVVPKIQRYRQMMGYR